MFKRFRFLLIISCLASFLNAQAQFDVPKSIEVGPHGGISYYVGDLNPVKHFAQSSWQAGAVIRYNQSNRWVYRLDYTYANVQASDEVIKWRPERGLNFFSTIHDLSLMVEFNFLEYYTGNPKRISRLICLRASRALCSTHAESPILQCMSCNLCKPKV